MLDFLQGIKRSLQEALPGTAGWVSAAPRCSQVQHYCARCCLPMWCSTAWSCLKNLKGFDNLNLQPTGDITIPEYEFAANMFDPPTLTLNWGVAVWGSAFGCIYLVHVDLCMSWSCTVGCTFSPLLELSSRAVALFNHVVFLPSSYNVGTKNCAASVLFLSSICPPFVLL